MLQVEVQTFDVLVPLAQGLRLLVANGDLKLWFVRKYVVPSKHVWVCCFVWTTSTHLWFIVYPTLYPTVDPSTFPTIYIVQSILLCIYIYTYGSNIGHVLLYSACGSQSRTHRKTRRNARIFVVLQAGTCFVFCLWISIQNTSKHRAERPPFFGFLNCL